jgi:hypothetical protein
MSDEDDALAGDAIERAAADSGLFSDLAEYFDEEQPFGSDGVIGSEEAAQDLEKDAGEDLGRDAADVLGKDGMIGDSAAAEDAGEGLGKDAAEEEGRFKTLPMDQKYVGEDERGVVYLHDPDDQAVYRVSIGDDGLIRDADGNLLDTTGMVSASGREGRAIWVMDKDGNIYIGAQERGVFQHSSFVAGEDVAGAGEISVEQGRVTYFSDQSGHYPFDRTYTSQAIDNLQSRGVSLPDTDWHAPPGLELLGG